MNLRPSGYEPDELPGCSIPRHFCWSSSAGGCIRILGFPRISSGGLGLAGLSARYVGSKGCEWVFVSRALASMPGDALLFRGLSHSTIGAVWFHGRVRDGIGWVTDAMVTKQWSERSWGFNRLYLALFDYRACLPLLMFCRVDGGGVYSQARTEPLGPVSFMRYRTSTPGLSTSWSTTAR